MAQVTEIQTGEFSSSSDGGVQAFSAKRQWRVVRDTPLENINIALLSGVSIGDPYSDNDPIPCVSIDSKSDGKSRLVSIITATYKTSSGGVSNGGVSGGGGGGSDPKSSAPQVRPAMYSMSSSLQQVAARGGYVLTEDGTQGPGAFRNSAGDLIDGMTRLEPVVTINIDQYSYTDQSSLLQYVGYINSEAFNFNALSIPMHCCMLQSISAKGHVETFGATTFRGFLVSFQFAYRRHVCEEISVGDISLGWDSPIIDSGYNIINTGLNSAQTEQEHLNLEHEDMQVAQPQQLATGTAGVKCRAAIVVAGQDGGMVQRPAAQPVALNSDGSPRSRSLAPRVYRAQTQPETAFGNNFSNFGIRGFG